MNYLGMYEKTLEKKKKRKDPGIPRASRKTLSRDWGVAEPVKNKNKTPQFDDLVFILGIVWLGYIVKKCQSLSSYLTSPIFQPHQDLPSLNIPPMLSQPCSPS